MSKESRGTLSVICGLVLVAMLAMVYSVRATTPANLPAATTQQSSEEAQSVSGTIASVGRNSFTITLGSAISKEGQETTPKSMTFLIDKNTTIDGKLKVGASADVTYRQDNGNNVAINVRVAS